MTTGISKRQLQNSVSTPATRELVSVYENLAQRLSNLVDIKRNPLDIYDPDIRDLVVETMMESIDSSVYGAFDTGNETGERIYMEGLTEEEDEPLTEMSVSEAHQHNLRALIENSLQDGATQMQITPNVNNRNINELTPLDAFVPMTIVRSYLPLCGKELIPYVVPKMDFIRFKEVKKWIVTKDGNKYRRPDVYNDMDAVQNIIASGKGRKVTNEWFPKGEEATGATEAGDGQYVDNEGVVRTIPDILRLENFDLLVESGGNRNIGDALSHDVYIDGARGVVTASDGKNYAVECIGVNGYYDVTSYTPQRSIQFDVTYTVHFENGSPDETFTDRILGTYDAENASFEVASLRGITRQVMFGGNLSNKNNNEYISFSTSFSTYQHTIGEGMRSNFPISYEDVKLYRDTTNIDIIANAVTEMTEIFIQLEDSSIIGFFDTCYKAKKDQINHGGLRFTDSVVTWESEIDLTYAAGNYFKVNESNQDRLQYALSTMISDISDVTGNEDFRAVLACHPNVARLMVGDNYSWSIKRGQAVSTSIRTDYNMGVFTAQGDSVKLVSTKKIKEDTGIHVLVYPVNEENYQTWKHFKRGLYFDRNHHVKEMPNNPNIMGVAMFEPHAYIPFQTRLIPKNYKTIKSVPRIINVPVATSSVSAFMMNDIETNMRQ